MSFSFGFSGEDVSSDDESIAGLNTQQAATPPVFEDPLSQFKVDKKNLPKEISLDKVLQSLVGHRLTFNEIEINNVKIYRRELFDIKHQLMMEEEEEQDNGEEFQILMGGTHEDLKNQVYEGGLKSWECSIDTVEYMSLLTYDNNNNSKMNFVELGCGTSLPSIFHFLQLLKFKIPLKLVLSDFNLSVLRLVTIPNLLINWTQTLEHDQLVALQQSTNSQVPIVTDELEITSELTRAFINAISAAHINFQFISGSWCELFLDVLQLDPEATSTLVVSSETIYSPQILPIVGELILRILKSSEVSNSSRAIVSAKDIYFGVGGSVSEFIRYLEMRRSQGVEIDLEVIKLKSNLQRSIVNIT